MQIRHTTESIFSKDLSLKSFSPFHTIRGDDSPLAKFKSIK